MYTLKTSHFLRYHHFFISPLEVIFYHLLINVYTVLEQLPDLEHLAKLAEFPFFVGLTVLRTENNKDKMSHVIRKPVYTICEQQRRRSACASPSLISAFIVHCLDCIIPLLAIVEISIH